MPEKSTQTLPVSLLPYEGSLSDRLFMTVAEKRRYAKEHAEMTYITPTKYKDYKHRSFFDFCTTTTKPRVEEDMGCT
jgi:hypothetical protein